MLKVPIGTSRVPINIWEVPIRTSTLSIGTSTMPIGTILRIFLLRFFFKLKTHPNPFFWDKPHPISCQLTLNLDLAHFLGNNTNLNRKIYRKFNTVFP